jgi:two-component system sensor histidine kinase UhpB
MGKLGMGGRKRFHEFPSTPVEPSRLRPLLSAQENERKRISRELHDEMGQGLMTLRLSLARLLDAADGPIKSTAEEALAILDDTIEGLRRIIGRLSPRPLEELGLLGAIRREAQLLSKQTGMQADLALSPNLDFIDQEVEIALYRFVQEALFNIARHSGGRNFTVALEYSAGMIALRIGDDGKGLSSNAVAGGENFGIEGMRDRAQDLGGSLRIRSGKGGGTHLLIEIPVNADSGTMRKRDADFAGRAS